MHPIKYVVKNKNIIDFEVMTLVNIIPVKNKLFYFFLCEYKVINQIKFDLIQFTEKEYYEIICNNYEIVK